MKRTIGFLKSEKTNEKRIALMPTHSSRIRNKSNIYLEQDYGSSMNISDEEYVNCGFNVISRKEIYELDIICDVKIGDVNDFSKFEKNKVLVGYFHAVQNKLLTDKLIDLKSTCYAWEDMYEDSRHLFWRNNELAGEAAVLHAFSFLGSMPYNCKVAVIGRGNTARGALKVLNCLGANVKVYDRKTENLFSKEFDQFDVIVNCLLWDTSRNDHIITREMLKKMKKGSMIIDVSCDKHGAVETCIPTSIKDPVYEVEGITHYCVDHTPSLLYKQASESFGDEIVKFLDELIEGNENEILINSKIMENGIIIDNRINEFQNR